MKKLKLIAIFVSLFIFAILLISMSDGSNPNLYG